MSVNNSKDMKDTGRHDMVESNETYKKLYQKVQKYKPLIETLIERIEATGDKSRVGILHKLKCVSSHLHDGAQKKRLTLESLGKYYDFLKVGFEKLEKSDKATGKSSLLGVKTDLTTDGNGNRNKGLRADAKDIHPASSTNDKKTLSASHPVEKVKKEEIESKQHSTTKTSAEVGGIKSNECKSEIVKDQKSAGASPKFSSDKSLCRRTGHINENDSNNTFQHVTETNREFARASLDFSRVEKRPPQAIKTPDDSKIEASNCFKPTNSRQSKLNGCSEELVNGNCKSAYPTFQNDRNGFSERESKAESGVCPYKPNGSGLPQQLEIGNTSNCNNVNLNRKDYLTQKPEMMNCKTEVSFHTVLSSSQQHHFQYKGFDSSTGIRSTYNSTLYHRSNRAISFNQRSTSYSANCQSVRTIPALLGNNLYKPEHSSTNFANFERNKYPAPQATQKMKSPFNPPFFNESAVQNFSNNDNFVKRNTDFSSSNHYQSGFSQSRNSIDCALSTDSYTSVNRPDGLSNSNQIKLSENKISERDPRRLTFQKRLNDDKATQNLNALKTVSDEVNRSSGRQFEDDRGNKNAQSGEQKSYNDSDSGSRRNDSDKRANHFHNEQYPFRVKPPPILSEKNGNNGNSRSIGVERSYHTEGNVMKNDQPSKHHYYSRYDNRSSDQWPISRSFNTNKREPYRNGSWQGYNEVGEKCYNNSNWKQQNQSKLHNGVRDSYQRNTGYGSDCKKEYLRISNRSNNARDTSEPCKLPYQQSVNKHQREASKSVTDDEKCLSQKETHRPQDYSKEAQRTVSKSPFYGYGEKNNSQWNSHKELVKRSSEKLGKHLDKCSSVNKDNDKQMSPDIEKRDNNVNIKKDCSRGRQNNDSSKSNDKVSSCLKNNFRKSDQNSESKLSKEKETGEKKIVLNESCTKIDQKSEKRLSKEKETVVKKTVLNENCRNMDESSEMKLLKEKESVEKRTTLSESSDKTTFKEIAHNSKNSSTTNAHVESNSKSSLDRKLINSKESNAGTKSPKDAVRRGSSSPKVKSKKSNDLLKNKCKKTSCENTNRKSSAINTNFNGDETIKEDSKKPSHGTLGNNSSKPDTSSIDVQSSCEDILVNEAINKVKDQINKDIFEVCLNESLTSGLWRKVLHTFLEKDKPLLLNNKKLEKIKKIIDIVSSSDDELTEKEYSDIKVKKNITDSTKASSSSKSVTSTVSSNTGSKRSSSPEKSKSGRSSKKKKLEHKSDESKDLQQKCHYNSSTGIKRCKRKLRLSISELDENSKKKKYKSELERLHDDLREMYPQDVLNISGVRTCRLKNDDNIFYKTKADDIDSKPISKKKSVKKKNHIKRIFGEDCETMENKSKDDCVNNFESPFEVDSSIRKLSTLNKSDIDSDKGSGTCSDDNEKPNKDLNDTTLRLKVSDDKTDLGNWVLKGFRNKDKLEKSEDCNTKVSQQNLISCECIVTERGSLDRNKSNNDSAQSTEFHNDNLLLLSEIAMVVGESVDGKNNSKPELEESPTAARKSESLDDQVKSCKIVVIKLPHKDETLEDNMMSESLDKDIEILSSDSPSSDRFKNKETLCSYIGSNNKTDEDVLENDSQNLISKKLKSSDVEDKPKVQIHEIGTTDLSLSLNEESINFVDKTYCQDKNCKNMMKCKICRYSNKAPLLVKHYKIDHPESEVLISRLSKEAAYEALQEFKKWHSTNICNKDTKIVFTCRMCPRVCRNVRSFYDHVSSHTGEYRYKCLNCSDEASNKDAIKSHFYKVHFNHMLPQNKNDYKNVFRVNAIADVNKFVYGYLCLRCNFVQLLRKNVEKHIQRYHNIEDSIDEMITKINLSSSHKYSNSSRTKGKSLKYSKSTAEVVEANESDKNIVTELSGKMRQEASDVGNSRKSIRASVTPETNGKMEVECSDADLDSVVNRSKNVKLELKVEPCFTRENDFDVSESDIALSMEHLRSTKYQCQSVSNISRAIGNCDKNKFSTDCSYSPESESFKDENSKSNMIEKNCSDGAAPKSNSTPSRSMMCELRSNKEGLKQMEDMNSLHTFDRTDQSAQENNAVVGSLTETVSDNKSDFKQSSIDYKVKSKLPDSANPASMPYVNCTEILTSFNQRLLNRVEFKDDITCIQIGLIRAYREGSGLLFSCLVKGCFLKSSVKIGAFINHIKESHTQIKFPFECSVCFDCQNLSGKNENMATSFLHLCKKHLTIRDKPKEAYPAELKINSLSESDSILPAVPVVSSPSLISLSSDTSDTIEEDDPFQNVRIENVISLNASSNFKIGNKKPVSELERLLETPAANSSSCSQNCGPHEHDTVVGDPPISVNEFKSESVVNVDGNCKVLASELSKKPVSGTFDYVNDWRLQLKRSISVKEEDVFNVMLAPRKLRHLFKCMDRKCSFTCDLVKKFEIHCKSHIEESLNDPVNDSTFEEMGVWKLCAYCFFSFKDPSSLCYHIDQEHSQSLYQCANCFYRTVSASNVISHQSICHNNVQFRILKCEVKSPSVTIRKEHPSLSAVILPYRCTAQSCSYITNGPDEFRKHLTQHKHMKQMQMCLYCANGNFIEDELIIEHYKTHSLDIYQCVYCIHGTDSKGAMHAHLCIKHPDFMPKAVMRITQHDVIQGVSGGLGLDLQECHFNDNCVSNDTTLEDVHFSRAIELLTNMSPGTTLEVDNTMKVARVITQNRYNK